MKQIKTLDLTRLNNARHLGFVNQFLGYAEADEAVKAQCTTQTTVLKNKYNAENEIYATSQKNLTTDKIEEADKKRDKCYSSLKASVKAYLNMPEGELLEAAEQLWQRLKDYDTDVNDSYNTETTKLRSINADFTGEFAEQATKLNLTTFLTQMNDANEEFATLYTDRNTEDSVKVAGALKAARTATDTAYKNFVMRVNALAITDGDHDYTAFIDNANELIDKYRTESKALKKSKKKEEEEESKK